VSTDLLQSLWGSPKQTSAPLMPPRTIRRIAHRWLPGQAVIRGQDKSDYPLTEYNSPNTRKEFVEHIQASGKIGDVHRIITFPQS